jgi:hypothetical protein
MQTNRGRLVLLRRGGNWNNASNAGLGALNLNNPRTNSNWTIGCRPRSPFTIDVR